MLMIVESVVVGGQLPRWLGLTEDVDAGSASLCDAGAVNPEQLLAGGKAKFQGLLAKQSILKQKLALGLN